jgi:SAM-dependent methyltransferase
MSSHHRAGGPSAGSSAVSHDALITDQFSRQAELFARSPELHGDEQLRLLVNAAQPKPGDEMLDVACGPGTVVAAFAPLVRRAVGLDATAAMLDQARALAAEHHLINAEWHWGDVYALPFADRSFDVVTCRFAFHHFEAPAKAFAEMVRVCRPGGRIVLCDGVAPADSRKAAAFNAMERHRDPSTAAFRPLSALRALFVDAGLPQPSVVPFQVVYAIEQLVAKSFPVDDNRVMLRQMIEDLVTGDAMEVGTGPGGTRFIYPAAVLTAIKRPSA